jgi:ABC-type antimicrobial peptide transport system permease subunit
MPRVAVISESLARRAFPDRDPIGRRFTGDLRNREASTYEIVGIVADTDLNDPRRRDHRDCVYVDYRQAAFAPQALTIHARASNAPAAIAAIRQAVHDTDPHLVPYDIRTIEEATDAMLSSERLTAVLTGFFGIAAALLCAVGIYGTVARDVAARIREIGIRVALGAPKWTLLSSLTRTLLAYTLAGVAVGILLLLGIAPAVRSLLTDVHPLEPFIIGASVLLLISVAALAAVIAARRASSIDAAAALRQD